MNTTFSQLDRTIVPTPKKISPETLLKLPNVEEIKLENGLRILFVENSKLPIVNSQLVIHTGSSIETQQNFGIANLTASMLDEGTKTKSSLEIADEIDYLGANFSSSASYDGIFISLQTLKENLDKAFEMYSEIIFSPSFPENDFERVKKEILTNLTQQKDRASTVASLVFNKILYKTHPYSSQVSGNENTVKSISIEDVKNFYKNYFAPNNATLIFVGDINKTEIEKLVNQFFLNWERKSVESDCPLLKKEMASTSLYIVDKPNAPQSEIRIGHVSVSRMTEDYFKLMVLQQILGSSHGRLFLNLREAKGYTYGAYANFSYRKQEGPFVASAGVRTDVTDSSVVEFLYEINRIYTELVSDEEFEMYKTSVLQRLPRQFETNGQIADYLSSIAVYDLPLNYFSSYIKNIESVTKKDILETAKKNLHPDNLSIVIVGDKSKILDGLKKLNLGNIRICDTDANILEDITK